MLGCEGQNNKGSSWPLRPDPLLLHSPHPSKNMSRLKTEKPAFSSFCSGSALALLWTLPALFLFHGEEAERREKTLNGCAVRLQPTQEQRRGTGNCSPNLRLPSNTLGRSLTVGKVTRAAPARAPVGLVHQGPEARLLLEGAVLLQAGELEQFCQVLRKTQKGSP